MKKTIIALVATIMAGACVFFACSKEEENTAKNGTKEKCIEQFSRDEIDLISEDIVNFHSHAIPVFIKDFYHKGEALTEDKKSEIYEFTINQFREYKEFDFIIKDATPVEECISLEKNTEILNKIVFNDDFSFSSFQNPDCAFDINFDAIDILTNFTNEIFSSIIGECENFESWSDLENCYKKKIHDNILSKLDNVNEYFCLKLYSDMLISSFASWSNYQYDGYGINKAKDKKEPSWWDKAKQKAKSFWNDAKPVVKADAAGAVAGALVGACAGGVGAGPGAATGGLSTSIGKCIENIF